MNGERKQMKNRLRKIIIFGLLCMLAVTGCSKTKAKNQTKKSGTKTESSDDIFAMDTYMSLKAYGSHGEKAIKAAKEEIQRLDALWSVGESQSEITRLNKEKKLKVSKETVELVKDSKKIWEETNGAFDLTVYPLMEAWGFTTQKYRIPSEKEIKNYLKLSIGMNRVQVDETSQTISLDKNAKIDLGGIAKGYTSSQVAQIFKENGVTSGMMSLGGNVQVIGKKPDGSRWKVGIQSPNDSMDMVGTYEAEDEGVITSGGYERYFEKNGKTYHHILDPATGKPSDSNLISVTIISSDGTSADMLSTTLFVLGKDKAISYWKKHQDKFQMILVDKNNKIYATHGIKDRFTSDYDVEIVER
jgi:thiamine biosynthesis lipoprotein